MLMSMLDWATTIETQEHGDPEITPDVSTGLRENSAVASSTRDNANPLLVVVLLE